MDPKLKAYWNACKKATDALWSLRNHMEKAYPIGTVLQSGIARFNGWTADLTGATIDAHLLNVETNAIHDQREPGVRIILATEQGDYRMRVCNLTYQQLLSRDKKDAEDDE
jgi:hypothetical protein